MTKEFKVGDRVRVYQLGGGYHTGVVVSVGTNNNNHPIVRVQDERDGEGIWYASPKQCRRLIRKPRKEITREMLEKAWRKSVNRENFIENIETKLGRKLREK